LNNLSVVEMKFMNSKYLRKKTLKFIILIISVLMLNSCISTSTLNQLVSEKISASKSSTVLFNDSYLVLDADSILKGNKKLEVRKKSSFFLPLGVFWGWQQKNEVKLPHQFMADIFNKTLIDRENTFDYEKIFNDKKLVIQISGFPDKFIYTQGGGYWFLPYIAGLGIYYTTEDIFMEKQNIEVKYNFYFKDEIIKSGIKKLEMKYPEYRITNPGTCNIEKYIDDFENEFEKICGDIIDEIYDDL